MSEDRHTSRDQNDIEIKSVNEDSPGIETMPDITPDMISPDPPQNNSESNQNDQAGSSNIESD